MPIDYTEMDLLDLRIKYKDNYEILKMIDALEYCLQGEDE